MCGIVGWIDWDENLIYQHPLISQMTDTLRHRGPDAQDVWLSPHAVLGHSRLIVIDPEGGRQPMVYNEGSYTYAITYNGELYNFQEVRRALEARGHMFRTYSDTEVLLHAYIEWKEDCVFHLNGIFAFGLWDSYKQQLFLARDHLGVKPLFYAQRGSAIFFGSEIKALLAHPLVKAEVNTEGLAELVSFTFPTHTPGFTIYHNIHEVCPGQRITFDHNGVHVSKYWSLSSAVHSDDLKTTTEHIQTLLVDIVRRQLVADVPVVTMLSGGLDSSGLTALAAREFQREGRQLQTYSIDFTESTQHFVSNTAHLSLDEPWAQQVSEYVGTKHQTLTVDTSELLKDLLVPMHAHDVPGLGQMETSLYQLCKSIKQDATVALSGESSDEIFGGYPWFQRKDSLNASTFPWMAMLGSTGTLQKRFSWLSTEIEEMAQSKAHIMRRYQEALAEVPRLKDEDSLQAKRREIFYLGLTRWLPVLLDRKDRMSMAVGFEVRVPFCDYRLVEYAWNVPWEMKTVDDIEKGILRRAFADVLPERVRNRRKSYYPASQHPAYLAGLRAWTLHILNDPGAPILSMLNIPNVRAMVEGPIPALLAAFIVSSLERIIQINAWLKDYQIHLIT